MPELPEVETVRRVLVNWVYGKTIKSIKCLYQPILENTTEEELNKCLANKKFDQIGRYGKFLVFQIGDKFLLSHLRMEGKFYFYSDIKNISKHVHVIFEMENGYLVYHDTRKFGKFYLGDLKDLYTNSPISKLGLEPFEIRDDNYLYSLAKEYNGTLKEFLLDQHIIAGIGNIYADEICFASRLLPFMKAKDLTKLDCALIVSNSIKVLTKAIKLGGSSVHSFTSGNDVDGKFQNELNVYGHYLEKCPVCSNTITKMVLGGRGTCLCSYCQSKNVTENPRVLGITGLIGSGKSTLSKYLERYGYTILDADKIAKEAYNDIDIQNNLLNTFGSIDKNKIRSEVILNTNKQKELNSIIHPYVYKKIKEIISTSNNKYILDVPLLFESKLSKLCDFIIVINVKESVRYNRIKLRNPDTFNQLIKLNNDTDLLYKKMKMADYVIDLSVEENNQKAMQLLASKITSIF